MRVEVIFMTFRTSLELGNVGLTGSAAVLERSCGQISLLHLLLFQHRLLLLRSTEPLIFGRLEGPSQGPNQFGVSLYHRTADGGLADEDLGRRYKTLFDVMTLLSP